MGKKNPEKTKSISAPRYSLGDIIDKMSILLMKVYHGEEDASEELIALRKGLLDQEIDGNFVLTCLRLAHINKCIWNLENDIRKGGEGKFSLEEIGRRAIEIRNLNRKRVHYKNLINRITNKGFQETKVFHQSQ